MSCSCSPTAVWPHLKPPLPKNAQQSKSRAQALNQNPLAFLLPIPLLLAPLHIRRRLLCQPLHLGQPAQLSNILPLIERLLDKRPAARLVSLDDGLAAGAALGIRGAADDHVPERRQEPADLMGHDA